MPATLVLKVLVIPALIGGSTLAGRRWGLAFGGWLIGLPFTSGPVALFLVLDRGTGFGARAATGMLAGTISQVAFCVAYGRLARGGPWLASALGTIAFGGSTLALSQVPLAPASAVCATLLAIGVGLLAMAHRPAGRPAPGPAPSWDLPLRMVVATGFVVVLTATAPALGAQLSGLLAPFPFIGATLAVFAHRQDGPDAASSVLLGLLHGLLAPATFFFALSTLLGTVSLLAAVAVAVITALTSHGLTLLVLRR